MSYITQELPTIRFANFLSPLLHNTYECIADAVGARIGYATSVSVGVSIDEFANGQADVGFLCGLLYVRMLASSECAVELLAAPVLSARRYQGRPIYFSDVIVHRDSPYKAFEELAGCTWAYNESASHSGCNLVCYSLLKRGKDPDYFGLRLRSGSHLNSLQLVLEGKAAAAAIDSHILDVLLRREPALASQVRVIDILGPSSIPPVVVAKRLHPLLKRQLQVALVELQYDEMIADKLHEGLIERFIPIADEQYRDIANMFAQVQEKNFLFV